MNDAPISFTILNFSEQLLRDDHLGHTVYSAVAHVDGEIFQYRKALNKEYLPPMAAIRSEAWLSLLQQIAQAQRRPYPLQMEKQK
jgi:hypothetical protein